MNAGVAQRQSASSPSWWRRFDSYRPLSAKASRDPYSLKGGAPVMPPAAGTTRRADADDRVIASDVSADLVEVARSI